MTSSVTPQIPIDEVQHPTLGLLKFPKDMPFEQRNQMIAQMEKEQPPQPTSQFRGPEQGTVLPWLKNLESDIRYGSTNTLPGKALHAMGAQGVNVGAQGNASDTIASPILGPTHFAQGAAVAPNSPWEGFKQMLKGGAETATLPGSFMAPAAAEAAPAALDATAAALAKAGPALSKAGEVAHQLPFLGRFFASQGRAAEGFQAVNRAAGKLPVEVTPKLSNAAMEVKSLADAGGQMPQVVGKFLKRVTDPNLPELTFEEARKFASNASRLSADQMQRLTPAARRLVGQFHGALNDTVQATADSAGVGEKFANAMKEYGQAAQNKQVLEMAVKFGKKYALPGGVAAYAMDKLTGIKK